MEAGGGLADKAQHSVTRSIQAVLETIAEAVVDQTSFRRVVVIFFSTDYAGKRRGQRRSDPAPYGGLPARRRRG